MRKVVQLLAVVAAVAVTAGPVGAVTFGAGVYGEFNTHNMEDWNDRVIAPANAGGYNIDDLGNSIGGGIDLRMWANPNWLFTAGWEPLFTSTDGTSPTSEDVTINLTGNAFHFGAAWMVPVGEMAKYGAGASIGIYQLNGEIEEGATTVEVEGDAVGFMISGLAEWTVSPGFGITAGLGYRMANAEETTLDGQHADPELETDYSGLTARLGVAFYLPSAQ